MVHQHETCVCRGLAAWILVLWRENHRNTAPTLHPAWNNHRLTHYTVTTLTTSTVFHLSPCCSMMYNSICYIFIYLAETTQNVCSLVFYLTCYTDLGVPWTALSQTFRCWCVCTSLVSHTASYPQTDAVNISMCKPIISGVQYATHSKPHPALGTCGTYFLFQFWKKNSDLVRHEFGSVQFEEKKCSSVHCAYQTLIL